MTDLSASRGLLADGCRVLAARGLSPGFLGHVSLRLDDSHLLIRCRGPHERGLAWTTPDDIRVVDFEGRAGCRGALDGGYEPPNELPIHVELLRADPRVAAVVHAHPPGVVAADLAGLRIRPIVGAFDIPGAKLAARVVPVYPRGVLIRSQSLAAEMRAVLGDHDVVVLRGHGLTSVGSSVQEAVLRAISVDTIARLSLQVVSAGGTLVDLPAADLDQLPDLGSAFNEGVAWRHELAHLEATGPR